MQWGRRGILPEAGHIHCSDEGAKHKQHLYGGARGGGVTRQALTDCSWATLTVIWAVRRPAACSAG